LLDASDGNIEHIVTPAFTTGKCNLHDQPFDLDVPWMVVNQPWSVHILPNVSNRKKEEKLLQA
jgi:hypothetical protein